MRPRLPLAVALSALLFLALGTTYSIVNPAYQSPDEVAHVDLVLSLQDLDEYPAPQGRTIDTALHEARRSTAWDKDAYSRDREGAPPRHDRPTLDEVDHGPSEQINHATQHPPLYYVSMAVGTSVVGIPLFSVVRATHDRVLGLQRLVNVLLMAMLPLLAAASVRALGGDRPRQVVAAVVMLAVPQLLYISSSVNNDNLLVAAFAGLTLAFCHVLAGRSTRRLAVLVGLLGTAAMWSKASGMIAPVWIGLVYAAVWWRTHPPDRRQLVRHGVLAMAVSTVLGGAWWLRNVVVVGALLPGGGLGLSPSPRDFDASVIAWGRGYVPRMTRSFWGNFGFLDVPLPLVVVVAATVLAIGVVAVTTRRAMTRDVSAIVLLVPIVLLVLGLGGYNYLRVYPGLYGRFTAAQGRYLFSAVPPLVVFCALHAPGVTERSVRVVTVVVLALQGLAVAVLVRTFYDGGLPAVLAWSPWPVWVTLSVLLGTLAAAAALVMTGADRHRLALLPERTTAP